MRIPRVILPLSLALLSTVCLLVGQMAAQSQASAGTFAQFSGRKLWYRDSGGTGVPVVLLHAGTGSALVWEHQVPAFTAAGYRVIAYDRLGFGKSSLDPGAAPGTSVDDLQGLMRHLGISTFHLAGTAAARV